MDDREIKKPNHLFPKMFKTFTVYIFATLLVFFGYVQIFGDVAPQVIQLPTGNTDAEEDNYFGSFVQNILKFKNIDTDVSLSFSNADSSVSLQLAGNVVCAENGVSLDVDLIYNGQAFQVQAVYDQRNVFLTMNNSTYMFDTTSLNNFEGSLDLSELVKFVVEVLDLDLSFVDEIGKFLGIDFANFNPNDLLSMLKVEEKLLDNGGYNFNLKLGSSIEAKLECDEKFNVVSAETNSILIKGNSLKISANVNKMNDVDVKTGAEARVEVSYEKTGNEIDMTGLADFSAFAKNLYENNCFVSTSIQMQIDDKTYFADLLIDTSDALKLKVSTHIEGLQVEVVYDNDEVFLSIENLRLRFALKDLQAWQKTIDEILLEHTGKDISAYLKELLSRFVEVDEGQLNFNNVLSKVLDFIFTDSDNLSVYLPSSSSTDENSYSLFWENGLSVQLQQKDQLIQSVSVKHSKFQFDANFEVVESGIELTGEYLDLIKAKKLLEYVNGGIFEFDFALSYNEWNVCGQDGKGTFKFFNGEIEISCENVCGEPFSVRIHKDDVSGQQTAYVAYGNMKFKMALPENSYSFDKAVMFEQIENLTSGVFGFKLDFGVFAELLYMLENYTLQDFLGNMIVDVFNTPNEIFLSISNKKQFMTSEVLNAKLTFEEDLLHSISLELYDVVEAQITINHTPVSTIEKFETEKYQDYAENFADGLLDSLRMEENVYAFESDIAIRYSNNAFYGKLKAMAVKSQSVDENGILKDVYIPAISLYTTSLGLSTYIYLIDDTIYIDIDGLQIQANLNETTITEIVDFVQENFGQFLPKNESFQPINPSVEAFKVIIPALDRIYGKWISCLADGKTISGLQIELGNHVQREDIVTIEKVFNEETEEFDLIEHFSNDVEDYGGLSNVLMYAQDSWFYNIILQAYVENINSTLVPKKIALGANIHDSNTILQEDYSDALLSCEESSTSKLNFAVYLTNIMVGEFVEDMNCNFISDMEGYQNIFAVKSNVSDVSYDLFDADDVVVTDLVHFNSYETLLDLTKAGMDYAMGLEYQINISGFVSSSTSTTKLDAELAVEAKDLPEGESNNTGINLFNGKELNVQANMDISTNYSEALDEATGDMKWSCDARHLIDIFYESNGYGLYASYQHSDYSDNIEETNNIESGAAFKAKVANARLSEIISMSLAFANVDLGNDLMGENGLNLVPNTTDFAFIQDLFGMNKQLDVGDSISKVDGLLHSATNITKMIKQVSLFAAEDLSATLTLKLDLDANDEAKAGQNIASIQIVFGGTKEEQKTVYSLEKILLQNVVVGENTFNFTITIGEFDKETSFDYDTTAQHIDFSDVSSFVDMTVNTINTQGFQFGGEMILSLIGIDAIKSYLDLEINLSDEGAVSAHVEVRTEAFMGATWGGINPKYTTWETFNKRVATLDFADGQLKLKQTTYQSRGRVKVLFDKTYVGDEILNNIVEIFAETLGLTDLAYNVMKDQISKIEAHPTLERAILGYRKDSSDAEIDKYVLSLAGENVTGMAGFKDFDLNITTSAPYEFSYNGISKQVKFLQAISTFIDIAGAVKLDLNLNSVTDKGDIYVVEENEVSYQFHTNEYYRARYLNHVHDIQFRENGGENVQDISGVVAGDSITLPVLPDKVTFNQEERTKTTWQFDGWWTTSTFEKGTKFLANVAPDKNLVLYAKWKVISIEHIYVVNIYHNQQLVRTMNLLEGESVSLSDFNDLEQLSAHGAEFFFKKDNSKFAAFTVHEDVDLYFKNYHSVSFDITWVKPAKWLNNGSLVSEAPVKPETFLVLEGTEIHPTDFAISGVKYKYGAFTHNFKMAAWNTTGCTSVAKGLTKIEGNGAYDVLDSLIINADTTLYATWAWA